ncbi:hypothetical protein DPMN_098039 [Dreissena polymorpha]|uniref:Uncharacterized protein n=1 Tax=Dreissena polymorpha TaxID=45954 RepID=A0A9D4LBC1_DREPO|nr:hypothetical protein DPMN_098039 [Dreissena polymorpha]
MCPPHRDTDGSRLTLGPLVASNVSCLLRHRLPSPDPRSSGCVQHLPEQPHCGASWSTVADTSVSQILQLSAQPLLVVASASLTRKPPVG